MDDYILIGAVFGVVAFCFVLASLLLKLLLKQVNKKIEDELLHRAVKEALAQIIFIRIEEHSDMQFAYNAITSEFLTQGKDFDEVNRNFGISFPKFRGIIVEPEDTIPNVL